MQRRHDESFDDEALTREGGVFVPLGGGREVGPDHRDRPQSDYVEDPDMDDGVPGTADDLPYDFGVEDPEAADHMLDGPDHVLAGFGSMGRTGGEDDRDEPPLGRPEERELQRRQRPLIEEAEAEEAHLAGLREEDMRRVVDAEAEGAEDPLPDAPDGLSATGSS